MILYTLYLLYQADNDNRRRKFLENDVSPRDAITYTKEPQKPVSNHWRQLRQTRPGLSVLTPFLSPHAVSVCFSVYNYCFDLMSKFRPFGVVLNPLFRILFSLWVHFFFFFPSNFRLTLQKFEINVFIVLFICIVSESPFLTGRIVCSPTWFGLFDEQYFVLNWLIIRCELRPELRQKRSWQHEARRINIPYCVCEANVRPVKNRLKNCVRRHRVNYWFGHNMFVR